MIAIWLFVCYFITSIQFTSKLYIHSKQNIFFLKFLIILKQTTQKARMIDVI